MLDFKVIDLQFKGIKQAIASFLVETEDGPVLIETGPHSTLPFLKQGLAEYGYQLEDIKHVLLSHIHLDHAGAAWVFAQHQAKIYVHPAGIKHLAAPEKLMASAKRIYQDEMDRLWGQMQAIDSELIMPVEHLANVQIGQFRFQALHTPGHAIHHIAWKVEHVIFTGDVGGVKIGNSPVVAPCPPPDINIEDWFKSIDLLLQQKPKQLALTHFGVLENVEEHCKDLKLILSSWAEWIKPYAEEKVPHSEVIPKFQAFAQKQLLEQGVDSAYLPTYETANPSWMSVAGLMRYWQKKKDI